VGQTIALGSAVFALFVLRRDVPPPARGVERCLAILGAGALLVLVSQIGLLAALGAALTPDDGSWPLPDVLRSTVGIAGVVRVMAALAVLGTMLLVRRQPHSRARRVLLLGSAVVLCATGALASHAMGRMDGRTWLLVVTALHHLAVGTWVGGLVGGAILALRAEAATGEAWLRPFSNVAATAVAAIAATGIGLALAYVATPGAAIGTSYGAMVLTKVVLFAALLIMGLQNRRALERWRAPAAVVPVLVRDGQANGHQAVAAGAAAMPAVAAAPPGVSMLLRRRLEVEAGLAVIAILLAASIGAAPPAVDVQDRRATLDEIRAIFTPQWPRLSTPSLTELASASDLSDPDGPRTAEMTAWSEFGHNVAGLFVLAMGILATLERTGKAPWARHWPLLIIVLTGFVAYSVDPEGWQTGAVGFWEHLVSPEVVQHRILLLLTAAFGFAEWRARSGRHPMSPWRYVFPIVAIWSGVLLLAHTHEVSDGKLAFFMELSHLMLGLLSLLTGWSRWLELRLPPAESARAGRIWGPALAAFGLLLVLYRES
jgi:putative copper resistance protein D